MRKSCGINSNSLITKLLVPMICVLLIQCLILLVTVFASGTIPRIKNTSISFFSEKINNRKNYFNNELTTRWRNIDSSLDKINAIAEATIPNESAFDNLNSVDNSYAYDFLFQTSTTIKEVIRQNSVTGAFVMLKGGEVQHYRLGMYMRDDDPFLNTSDFSDLTLEVAPEGFVDGIIPQSSDFAYAFKMKDAEANFDFYNKPIQAYKDFPKLSASDLGFWSAPFLLHNKTRELITYTVPLINEYGNIYGIMGIDLSLQYINSLLPYTDLEPKGNASYIFGYQNTASNKFDVITYTGPLYLKYLSKGIAELEVRDISLGKEVTLKHKNKNEKMVLINHSINIYNSNTPFSETQLQIVGVVDADVVYAAATRLQNSIVMATIVSVLFSIILFFISVVLITKPLRKLTVKIKNSRQSSGVMKFDKTKIEEIDQLTAAIEELNEDLMESSKKMSQIIELADMPIATFELDYDKHKAFYTDNIFTLLGLTDCSEWKFEQLQEKIEEFKEISEIRNYNGEDNSYVFKNYQMKWFQLKTVESESKSLGVIRDVTKEMVEKSKLEYERDYDILTDILNRRAFNRNVQMIFVENEIRIGAFIMLDLDNLKHINDQYGHDFGDEYIRAMANVLKYYYDENHILIGRMAGDEFFVFLYGYNSQDEVRYEIMKIKNSINSTFVSLPNNQSAKLRASAGVSWYPKDATNYEDLIKYADYAMYEIKATVKGEFNDFNVASYIKESYLLENREELNKLIENEMIEFHFQPIVEVSTGKIIAYEALMRSKLDTFKSPKEILNVAKVQSKLGAIEKMTLYNAIAYFDKNNDKFGDKKIFINSIANQILSVEEIADIEKKYSKLLKNIVIEFTESEQINELLVIKKLDCLERWGAGVAIDDFGTGYNSESILLMIEPDYIKIDMSIVRNINQDLNRQTLVANIVSYAKARKIKIIGEGVESIEEYEELIKLGIDMVQGYFVAMPTSEPLEFVVGRTEELQRIYKQQKITNRAKSN